MNASTFLDELHAAGIRLSLAGDDLRFATEPGISIAPFRERLVANKTSLVAALQLQEQIIAAGTVDPAHFNRVKYDSLWEMWHIRHSEEKIA